jgi:nucleoside-diphosphate-sugar epimerase
MLKRVIIFGVHSYIGFGLCERLISEGVEVKAILSKPKDTYQRKMLEERLLMIGRNALLHITNVYEKTDDDNEIDMILHCCDDSREDSLMKEDRVNVKKSVELAQLLSIPYVYIASRNQDEKDTRKEHIKYCENYLNEHLKTRSYIKLPCLYGPFQPSTERIHQYLVDHEKHKNNLLIIDEPILFIQDAIQSIWGLLENVKSGTTYFIHADVKQEKESSFLLEFRKNEYFPKHDENETIYMKESTSIEEGLMDQATCIEKFNQILKM